MKHLFIINPVAGKINKSRQTLEKIETLMKSQNMEYECVLTKAPMDAVNIVRSAAENGEELRVYACGGDGTLNEVVNGAAGYPNVAVTHFPTGSGNDFIRIFGADARRFFEFEELLDHEIAEFDLIDCNGRLCLNICSIGLDARIGTEMKNFKKIPLLSGTGAYRLSTIYHVIRGIHRQYNVCVDGQLFAGRFTMLVAANGRYYGGGVNPLPEAQPEDGQLEFLLVKAVSRLTVAGVMGGYKAGNHKQYPRFFTHLSGRCMEIVSNEGQTPVNIDGELIFAQKTRMILSEQKIRFFFPRGANWRQNAETRN